MRSSRAKLLLSAGAVLLLLPTLAACAAAPPPAPKPPAVPPPAPVAAAQLIRVHTPVANGLAKNPLHVTGEAHGSWYSDATFTLVLYDYAGRELTRGYAQAQGESTTDEFVPFEADLDFTPGDAQRGTLVLEKATKAGCQAAALRLPVRLPGSPSRAHPTPVAKRAL